MTDIQLNDPQTLYNPEVSVVVKQTLRDLLPAVAESLRPPGDARPVCWAPPKTICVGLRSRA